MIHSRRKQPDEIFEFCDRVSQLPEQVPIVAVPTSYHQVTEEELADHGVNVVIYANHLLRAAYPQMVKVAETILQQRPGAGGRPLPRADQGRAGDHPREPRMIDPARFVDHLAELGVTMFTGVPDSLLKSFGKHVHQALPREQHVIAANEGAAVGLALGHHLRTGEVAAVYLQNSGFGNTINPLLSLADPDVYGAPMLVIVGWRGQPGVKDEPQHVKQGRVQEALLDALELPWAVLPGDPAEAERTVERPCVPRSRTGGPLVPARRQGHLRRRATASDAAAAPHRPRRCPRGRRR
jgi:sulfopyruvate decarboxylase TPP-binding subunit